MAKKSQAPAADPHAGQGGSYLRDPKTGLRSLVARTQSTAEAVFAPAQAEPDSTEVKPAEE